MSPRCPLLWHVFPSPVCLSVGPLSLYRPSSWHCHGTGRFKQNELSLSLSPPPRANASFTRHCRCVSAVGLSFSGMMMMMVMTMTMMTMMTTLLLRHFHLKHRGQRLAFVDRLADGEVGSLGGVAGRVAAQEGSVFEELLVWCAGRHAPPPHSQGLSVRQRHLGLDFVEELIEAALGLAPADGHLAAVVDDLDEVLGLSVDAFLPELPEDRRGEGRLLVVKHVHRAECSRDCAVVSTHQKELQRHEPHVAHAGVLLDDLGCLSE
mmetsp:Transcript_36620/g.91729  ORF Transcript_36620/g.91729 Transcript_36620/m.91729 type:complete len:264 (+) Transcript_36620:634-1425(+)